MAAAVRRAANVVVFLWWFGAVWLCFEVDFWLSDRWEPDRAHVDGSF